MPARRVDGRPLVVVNARARVRALVINALVAQEFLHLAGIGARTGAVPALPASALRRRAAPGNEAESAIRAWVDLVGRSLNDRPRTEGRRLEDAGQSVSNRTKMLDS